MFSPCKKAIKFLQETYKENESKDVPMSKAELTDLLYEGVSTQPAIITNARRVLVDKGIVSWPAKLDRCVLHLDLVKQEKI